ncbi:MAG: aconitase X catalytic domain-containing protein [Hyphomicrobiales bacterium]|nr:aconitase X catalytic domain-containing protein [Hyphomicrobiales bacterium]MCP5372206.1 aconitase X catalytic domain-containing protein [Hyphomicrobiales bacterium]
MRLDDEEKAMLAGELGPARQYAMEQIVRVGDFFDAADCVPVSQVHLMADPESLGAAGVEFLERLAALPADQRKVRVPTVTDPRGVDFEAYRELGQSDEMADLERRAVAAFTSLGILMTDTCINYQTVMPPVLGEHLAFGDTGSSIYANSVQGARTNFQGGPSALAAALSGRVPRYGYHLDACRRGRKLFDLRDRPRDLAHWGAVGGIIGRQMESYWDVPVITGVDGTPTSDELKQLGAALASFGSTPLFHMVGVTPEAPDLAAVFDGDPPPPVAIDAAAIAAFVDSYRPADDQLDVVVFSAPQLSLVEMRTLADLLAGRRVHDGVTLLAATSPEIAAACERMGIAATIRDAGGRVLKGVCFYQMYAREIGEARGWRRLMTNSAKLVNIIAGYGYEPLLGSMERCVDSAVAGRILP